MLFDHDAKVGGDSARFADLLASGRESARRKEEAALGCRGGAHEPGNLRAEITALFALTHGAGLVRQDNEDAAYAGGRLFAVTADLSAPPARAWDHADRDAVLWRPRRAGSTATPALQLRGCRLRPITEDYTLGSLIWAPTCSRRCSNGTWTAGWIVQPI
jgi:hypothetical protein